MTEFDVETRLADYFTWLEDSTGQAMSPGARTDTTTTPGSAGGQRRWWLLGAAAACVATLVGGLVLFSGDDQALSPATVPVPGPTTAPDTQTSTAFEPAPTSVPGPSVPIAPTTSDLVVSDPAAISLDEWIDPASLPPIDTSIVEIDREALPSGWMVSEEAAGLRMFPDDLSGYHYSAVVTTDDQASFDVTYSRDPEPFNSDPCFVPLAGHSGTVGDLTGETIGDAVCGERADGSSLAVVPRSGVGLWSALDVATSVSFVQADEVPNPDLTSAMGDEEPADVDLAGTLSGVRWAITVEPSGTRRIDNYVVGEFRSGMEGSSESLNGGPLPLFADSTIDGVSGYGAIIYGHVDGDAVAVIVTTADQRTARLPMLLNDGRSAFAVPVPDSVDVASLTFIDATDTVIAIADVPDIPVGYVSGALSLIPRR